MIRRLRKMRAAVLDRYPESKLETLTAKEMGHVKKRFPDLPVHLANFFQEFGCGCIGNSRYMLYDLFDPEEIFDQETAANLEGVYLIGDDFSGNHEAYNTKAKWKFGHIGGGGEFHPHTDYKTIIDFVKNWYADSNP